jgi:hypothetical protein
MPSWDKIAADIRGVQWTDPPRIPFLTCSGTWAAPGTGYCSWVVQAADQSRVIEVPVQAPWSFGPIGNPGAPSYQESVQIGLEWAVDWLNANTGPFGLSGYSQGGECASRIYMELQPGGRVAHRMPDFIGGFTFGNPSREDVSGRNPKKKTSGIALDRIEGTPSTWLDLAEPGDMYTCTPDDDPAGDIIRDCYTMAIQIGIGSPMTFIQNLIDIAKNLGASGDANIVDVIQAMTIAITFFAQGTAPHIQYEFREVEPGVTYLQAAINHVNALTLAA